MDKIERFAQLNHGAIEVDDASDGVPPLLVVIAGPIKHWWTGDNFGSDSHKAYLKWRDAVEYAIVHSGFLVYKPYSALRGAWHERAQLINNTAIEQAEVMVVLTPPGIPADGTDHEITFAERQDTIVVHAPPGDVVDLAKLVYLLDEIRTELY